MNKLIAALSTGLSVVALGAAIAFSQSFTMPPPGGIVVMGCAYNASPPTLTDGQTGIVQCSSTGSIGGGGGGGGGPAAITSPLGHATVDTSAVSVVPSATATFPSTQSGAWSVTSNAGTNLNTSALALDTSVGTTNTDLGALGTATCATDTGSCNLNAKLSRIAERLTAILLATAVTIADGANVTQGAIADSAYAGSGNCTIIQCLKGLYAVAASSVAATTGPTTGGAATAIISCNLHVFKHITSATDTLAVQGVASQTIRICGWRSRAAGTATWYLENTASTNANCASTLTQITGVASEVANSGETLLAPFWTGLSNTSGNGLCINSTGTGGVDIDIWYTQF